MTMFNQIIQSFDSFYMLNLLSMFIILLSLNLIILSVIKKGYLGDGIKISLNSLLVSNIRLNMFSLSMFILGILLIYIVNNNAIYLEDKVIVSAKIENTTFIFSGDVIDTIFQNIGSAGVFSASARIAASLVAKQKLSLLPKTGIIGGTAVGFTASFKLVNLMLSEGNSGSATIETGPIEIKIDNLKILGDNSVGEYKSILNRIFGIDKTLANKLTLTDEVKGGFHNIRADGNSSNSIIQELDKQTPNWKDSFFIPSPIEPVSNQTQFILESLNLNLIIKFVTVYLLIMLLVILICKLVLKDNINFNNLNKYPLGTYINYILSKYVTIWQKSSNIFIFLIVISLIFFNSISLISIYQLIRLLS